MLTKLPLPWLSPTGTRVRQQGGGLRFSLYTPAVTFINDFLSRLEPAQSVVFHAEPDPEADAMLVWEPGRRQPTAISVEGASGDPVAGCFVAFVPAGKNEITLVEDGFLMAFTAESWDEVRGAMQLGLPASVPGPSGLPIFELSWWPPAPKADRTPN